MMSRFPTFTSILPLIVASAVAAARPYPTGTGLAAAADSATTASSNPAGITRLDQRTVEGRLILVTSESNWESKLGSTGREFNSEDSSSTVVPMVYYVQPLGDRFSLSFTFLGTSFSDDFGNWPGRYFIKSYDALNISAFPSLAYRVDHKLSVAASAAVSYSRFEQERAIANIFDPGFGDGNARLKADGTEVGFGLSLLYETSPGTRWGAAYQSEQTPELDGDVRFSGLGPNTGSVFQNLGISGSNVQLTSKSPQRLVAGLYHEFPNAHAITVDIAWSDFSNFQLSERYFDGKSFALNKAKYRDIYAVSASYSWPVAPRWMLGVGGLYTNDMIDDDERTMILRLDTLWSVGLAAEWQWTDSRVIKAGLNYIGQGDAPVTTPAIPGIGSLEGKFASRDLFVLEIGMSWKAL
jgi:long-chain fatty acid transport protein